MSKNGKLCAFPVVETESGPAGDRMVCTDGGLSKREYFAAKSLQGLRASSIPLADPITGKVPELRDSDLVARTAVLDADALLAELAKGGGQ